MADTKISALSAAVEALLTHEYAVNEAGASKKVTLAQIATQLGGNLYNAPGADFDVASTSDITIATTNITTVAGDQLDVNAWFTILNNSTATRIITITLDFDGLFDIELATGALATSATLIHPIRMNAILDIRSASLSYAMVFMEQQLLAGIASGTDTTSAATHLQAKGWGTSATDLTGTTTVSLVARSAAATATQTLRLHTFNVRRVTP